MQYMLQSLHPCMVSSSLTLFRGVVYFRYQRVWEWISMSLLFLSKLMPYILCMCTHIYLINLSVSLKDANLNYIQAYNEMSILDQPKYSIQGITFYKHFQGSFCLHQLFISAIITDKPMKTLHTLCSYSLVKNTDSV